MDGGIEVREWKSIKELFCSLNNSKCNYIVLRNYEELLQEQFLEGHADIDFLCEKAERLVLCASALPRGDEEDGVHYYVMINNNRVPIDIREVGDGYYDSKWEQKMIATKVLFKNLCYVPDAENYYYSLCYHVLVHKNEISEDYFRRLCIMGNTLGIFQKNFLQNLEKYMKDMSYKYWYPVDRGVCFNVQNKDKKLLKFEFKHYWPRAIVKIKRRVKKWLDRDN